MSRVTTPAVRFNADEFERMVDADVFGTRRVELLNGRVYFMTQNGPHMAAVSKACRVLFRLQLPTDWVISQGTLRLDRLTMPDPDVMWLPVPVGTPVMDWPAPLLVIEVSDTTYKKDTGIKLRKYALHGLADYWIENLKADRIEVYRDPQNPTGKLDACCYASVRHYARGESITPLARPEVTIAVDDLLP